MSELIILSKLSSYRQRLVVWYVAEKEAGKMRKTLEDLYYGNITPNEQDMVPSSELKRAVDRVAQCEKQLEEILDETGWTILTRLTRSQ